MHLAVGEPGWTRYEVVLDGEALRDCVEADDLGGWARVADYDGDGREVLRTRVGVVRFRRLTFGSATLLGARDVPR